MKTEDNTRSVGKDIAIVLCSTALLLMIPLVAMQLTDGANWGIGDFVLAGLLLATTGLVYMFVARKLTSSAQRIILAILLGAALALTWIQLSVGIL